MAKSYFIGKEGQSLLDLSFMAYGRYDLIKLVKENPFLGNVDNDDDVIGQKIYYTPENTNGTAILGLMNRELTTGVFRATAPPFIPGSYKIFQDGIDFAFQDGADYIFEG